ncbi:helix-turn-helix domain-containing protein [Anaerotalea alkaliphila]|uniref:Helix-turn-helix transcriptional regulator n=1 Tax=Anaerotalea alkaliphila TaxID=2662126 RepID=A0A7X5HWG0_9FIRM|nr:helix-turn-helix transcriptional regulator [Anaerotalea alkaliphila]NDL67903.1 helix-turn-helix transcriptional regulator [Anaerotalea alkaliphila]
MKILSTKKLSETVNRFRKENGFTIEDLENIIRLDKKILHRIECGDFIPSMNQYAALANALDLKLEDLTVEKDKSNSFAKLMDKVKTANEKEGLEKLFSMMIALKQQIHLRQTINNK